MRSPFNPCSCTVKVREDYKIDLYELSRGKVPEDMEVEDAGCPRGKSLAELVRDALQAVRKAALAHKRHVHRVHKLKLESLPPRLDDRGQVARTGQWVGLVEYHEAGKGCIELVIEPKYNQFHKIYEEVVEKSRVLSPSLALAVADLHLGSPGSLLAINAAIWAIEEYILRNPPYLVMEEPLYSARPIPHGVLPVKRRIQLNEKYYTTLAAFVSILSQTIMSTSVYNSTPLLKAMAASYRKLQQELLTSLATNPYIVEALHGYWLEDPDEDALLEVKAAARYAPVPGTGRGAWLMLTPAPKIYEVYVFIKTTEALKKKHGGEIVTCGRTLHCYIAKNGMRKIARIYYNRPPAKYSRLVYRMVGSRPHPDILLTYNDDKTRIIIDAKYRLAFSLVSHDTSSRLRLGEALRLLGYIADLAHNKSLRAILAVPEKTKTKNRLSKLLNDLSINVELVEVNPRVHEAELIRILP